MRISESGAQEWTLAGAPAGRAVDVIAVTAGARSSLLVHGIRAGARLVVEADAPFGGPRIVRLGRARVAIDRGVAGAVRVTSTPQP